MAHGAQGSATLWSRIVEFLQDYIWFPLSNIEFVNIIDIFLLSVLFYMVYKFIKERRASRTIIGILVLGFIYAVIKQKIQERLL